MKVLVTGASGFIGSHLLPLLKSRGLDVLATSRSPSTGDGVEWQRSPDLGPDADWSTLLRGTDAVVHLAGRTHVLHGEQRHKEDLCRRINTEGTRSLARQAARAGVRNFIYLSSCHAVAEESDQMLTRDTPPRPVSAYGRSKLAAENALREELDDSHCAWTIMRPPLVYGVGNKANFGLLVKLIQTGIPLPLASVRNRRSLIYVENLVDLITVCLGNTKAFEKTFYPCDGEDVSTSELIRAIARASASVEEDRRGKIVDGSTTRHPLHAARYAPPCLFAFPESLLKVMGRLPGLGALRKLTSSLYVDSEPIRRELGWNPPFSMQEGLRRTL